MESCGAMQRILLHSKIPMLEEGMHFVPSFKKEGMLPLPRVFLTLCSLCRVVPNTPPLKHLPSDSL